MSTCARSHRGRPPASHQAIANALHGHSLFVAHSPHGVVKLGPKDGSRWGTHDGGGPPFLLRAAVDIRDAWGIHVGVLRIVCSSIRASNQVLLALAESPIVRGLNKGVWKIIVARAAISIEGKKHRQLKPHVPKALW